MTTTRPIVPRVNGDSSVGVPDKHWGKSYIDEGHFDSVKLNGGDLGEYLAESTGYGIVSGCEPSISGLTVTVGAGIVHLADGTRKELSATNITLDSADPSNPRIDLVYITSAGEVAKVTGTAAASPVVPSVPSGGISVAQVSVAANASSGDVTDTRQRTNIYSNMGVVISGNNVINIPDRNAGLMYVSSVYFNNENRTETRYYSQGFTYDYDNDCYYVSFERNNAKQVIAKLSNTFELIDETEYTNLGHVSILGYGRGKLTTMVDTNVLAVINVSDMTIENRKTLTGVEVSGMIYDRKRDRYIGVGGNPSVVLRLAYFDINFNLISQEYVYGTSTDSFNNGLEVIDDYLILPDLTHIACYNLVTKQVVSTSRFPSRYNIDFIEVEDIAFNGNDIYVLANANGKSYDYTLDRCNIYKLEKYEPIVNVKRETYFCRIEVDTIKQTGNYLVGELTKDVLGIRMWKTTTDNWGLPSIPGENTTFGLLTVYDGNRNGSTSWVTQIFTSLHSESMGYTYIRHFTGSWSDWIRMDANWLKSGSQITIQNLTTAGFITSSEKILDFIVPLTRPSLSKRATFVGTIGAVQDGTWLASDKPVTTPVVVSDLGARFSIRESNGWGTNVNNKPVGIVINGTLTFN